MVNITYNFALRIRILLEYVTIYYHKLPSDTFTFTCIVYEISFYIPYITFFVPPSKFGLI